MALTRLAAKPWPLQAIRRAHSSHVDSALADALQRAARRVQKIDPTATVVPRSGTPADRGDGWDESAAPGVRTPGEKMILRFTCTHEPCDTDDGSRVTTKTISKKSYQHGIVLVKCECKKLHLIADNLDWFGSGKTNIEDILSARGEEVRRQGYWTDGRDVFEVGR